MLNITELQSRDIKELRLLAAQHGINPHHAMKAPKLAKMIVDAATASKPQPMQSPAERPAVQTATPTPEQVKEALGDLIMKPGFLAQFHDDNTWTFSYRGAEESGHMSVPLRWIKIKAQQVARGALVPRGFKDKQLNTTLNSGTIMMV